MRATRELKKNVLATVRSHGALVALSGAERPRNHTYPRKSRLQRYLELLYVSLRWGETTSAYYAQEADRKDRSVFRDFLSYRRFKSLRDRQNRRQGSHPFDYCCFLQDKLLLERHLRSHGFRTPTTLGVIHPDLKLETGERRRPLRDALADPSFSLEGFCKPQFGMQGAGVFLLRIADGELSINEQSSTLEDLQKRITMPYLIQVPVRQHPDLARLHPRSVNTVRIITILHGDDVEIFISCFRMGIGGSLTDNSVEGKLIVNVDRNTNRLEEIGYLGREDDYRPMTRHPDTGIRLADVEVPMFQRCCELAVSAHRSLPMIRSVGWDLAIEPDGVCFLEGNDSWGGKSAMWLMPDFAEQVRRRFGS
jgi:hypothetical protein